MQFIDRAEIEVEGGKGGDGMIAFRREKYVPAGGPAGGNGGKGGSVILQAEGNLQTLLDFRYARRFKADNGKRGGPNNCTGAMGKDIIIEVPCGTVIYDLETQEMLGDLVEQGQTLCVAEGGKGGLGNKHFLSNKNRAPEYALPGLEGELRNLRLELKLLAEVGIIGLPNAGKSTLIASLSAARPKIADYPFTTLVPNLGVVRKPTGDGTVFADIPGLIAGAHEGVGLGHEFLRHIERTRLLLHLVDVTSDDPLQDYEVIQQELNAYGRGLCDRPQIIALNKVDACDQETLELIKEELQPLSDSPVFTISAVTKTGVAELLQAIWNRLEQVNLNDENSSSQLVGTRRELSL
ncbi:MULTISPECIES: GTPase ObgE [Crocosphaera]|uniref:GTPase Obg n=5 Tax=Crocosphaera watsonii TaxID=263511 RepID=G5J2F7_CROWT|nr:MULTISPECIES: GTPase ObgE [Crocosphaera]EHJ13620.1 GTP-binding protein Obg [Crocosphaera watsonii WH 0003]MCH2243573.1 GTPase ObgE [Crocosphaera sp.]NQZ61831.1 GTPase ObgE [Crocosphaera sp.]CCQ52981.1 COG0536: GTP-binding protein Obg [Crocosphaera watsonii WH 8502]CCQ58004.1 COG0536: GTP-binding protein Obg [Crocosphaera watsonii WH 0005]